MKKTDIGVVVIMYAVCAFFYSMCVDLKEESQTYPMFTILLLFAFTTMYLLQMIYKARKYGVESGADEVFEGFMPKQFAVCAVLIFLYLIMTYYIGFYISTVIFMTVVMLFLKVPKKYILITVVALIILLYCAFTRFLGVKLPVGEFIKPLL